MNGTKALIKGPQYVDYISIKLEKKKTAHPHPPAPESHLGPSAI